MPNVVRFTLPTARTLKIPGAGSFLAGVLDVDANNLSLVTRTRYLVKPYGAIEVGIVPAGTAPPALPAVPAAPNPDPYPQYVTDADLTNPASGPMSTLRSAYGRGLEIAGVFTGLADGAVPTKVLTAQTATAYGASDVSGRQPAIVGGKLTYASSSQFLGSYYQVHAEGDVVYLSAGFTFSSWTTGGGLACIALTEQDFVAYHRANNAVPRAPFHLTISPEAWNLEAFPTAGGAAVSLIGGGKLWAGGNLAANGTTVHRVTAVIDKSKGHASLFMPNGAIFQVSHAHLGIPGSFAFVESYRDALSGRTQVGFTDFSFDSRRIDLIPAAASAGVTATTLP